jgi:hypothetical protein
MGNYSVLAVKVLHNAEFFSVTSGGIYSIPLDCKRLVQLGGGSGTALHSEFITEHTHTHTHTHIVLAECRAGGTYSDRPTDRPAIVVKVKPLILFQELLEVAMQLEVADGSCKLVAPCYIRKWYHRRFCGLGFTVLSVVPQMGHCV